MGQLDVSTASIALHGDQAAAFQINQVYARREILNQPGAKRLTPRQQFEQSAFRWPQPSEAVGYQIHQARRLRKAPPPVPHLVLAHE